MEKQMDRRGILCVDAGCQADRFAALAREIAGSASIGANRRPAAGLIQQVQLSFYDKKAGTNLREFSIPQGSIVSKIDPGVVSVSYPTGEMIFLSVQRGVRGMIRLQSTAGFPKSGKRAAFKARGSGSDRCIPSYND